MEVVRFVCGCDGYSSPCYQAGNNHYIALPTDDSSHFTLNVSKIIQKDKEFWLGGHKAHEIDFISAVPQVEDHLRQDLFSTKLSEKKNYPNYQRRLGVPRARAYGEWWSKRGSSSVNAVVLAINKQYSVSEEQTDDKIWAEQKDDTNFYRLHISTDWLKNSCDSCGTVTDQLEKIIGSTDERVTEAEKQSANAALDEINEWVKETDSELTAAKTYHCLNKLCPSLDDDGNPGHYHHSSTRGLRPVSKPFEIIDGQHRVKGSQQGSSRDSSLGDCVDCGIPWKYPECEDKGCTREQIPPAAEEMITFSLVAKEGNFKDNFHGVLFTEITTEARKLSAEHQFYMQWRFAIDTDKKVDLFKKGLEDAPPSVTATDGKFSFTEGSIADLTYRVILKLNSTGFLANRIRPLGGLATATDEEKTAYYLTDMKKCWEWTYNVMYEYFLKLKKKNPTTNKYTDSRYGTAASHIDTIQEAINTYLQACADHWFNDTQLPNGDVYWSNTVDSPGRISGVKSTTGHLESGTAKKNNSHWFQIIVYLMPYVFKEVSMDRLFAETPGATEDDLAECDLGLEYWQKFVDPSSITRDEIIQVISHIDSIDFGVEDGMQQDWATRSLGRFVVDEVLSKLITKPISEEDDYEPLHYEILDFP